MATPGQLVDAIAAATGVPRPTVADYDRRLAESGLRKSGGRGLSAAKMGPEDAAALLLALLSGEGGSRTVPAVKRLWALLPDAAAKPTYSMTFRQEWLAAPVIDPAAKTAGEVLTSLLATAAAGHLTHRLTLAGGEPGVLVSHIARSSDLRISIFADDIDNPNGDHVLFGKRAKPQPGGMAEVRHFGLEVIEAVGGALAEKTVGGDG